MTSVADLVARVRPAGAADAAAVRRRVDALAKPPGSLGALEDVAVRLATALGDPPLALRRRTVLVFAADHGVAARGVSAYPPGVTALMCGAFVSGGAAVSALARSAGAEVVAVDVGVDAPPGALPGVMDGKVRRGSRDLSVEDALTPAEVCQAVLVGAAAVLTRAAGTDVFALGDMGIGNTTAAGAVTAALLGMPAAAMVGPGTGVDAAGRARKEAAVTAALARLGDSRDPLRVLAACGGLEIAAVAGAVLAAASASRPVVTDGFITTAGALAAVRLAPAAADWLFASHRSPEPGHHAQLAALGLEPLLDLRLRLGEGTGAVLALPLLDAAGSMLRHMAPLAAVLPRPGA
jgi:nicotinate-nucleotide--dimethylbenzimidazole phosphoribosyltransferase